MTHRSLPVPPTGVSEFSLGLIQPDFLDIQFTDRLNGYFSGPLDAPSYIPSGCTRKFGDYAMADSAIRVGGF